MLLHIADPRCAVCFVKRTHQIFRSHQKDTNIVEMIKDHALICHVFHVDNEKAMVAAETHLICRYHYSLPVGRKKGPFIKPLGKVELGNMAKMQARRVDVLSAAALWESQLGDQDKEVETSIKSAAGAAAEKRGGGQGGIRSSSSSSSSSSTAAGAATDLVSSSSAESSDGTDSDELASRLVTGTRVGPRYQVDPGTIPMLKPKGEDLPDEPRSGCRLLFSGSAGVGEASTLHQIAKDRMLGTTDAKVDGCTNPIDAYLAHSRKQMVPPSGALVWLRSSGPSGHKHPKPVGDRGMEQGVPAAAANKLQLDLQPVRVLSTTAEGNVAVQPLRHKLGAQSPSALVVGRGQVVRHIDTVAVLGELSCGASAPSPSSDCPLLWTDSQHKRFVQCFAKHGKDFRRLAEACKRPMNEVVEYFYLHKYSLKTVHEKKRPRRSARTADSLGPRISQRFSAEPGHRCRKCNASGEFVAGLVCTRRNCSSFTCEACLVEESSDEVAAKANEGWRCGRCQKMRLSASLGLRQWDVKEQELIWRQIKAQAQWQHAGIKKKKKKKKKQKKEEEEDAGPVAPRASKQRPTHVLLQMAPVTSSTGIDAALVSDDMAAMASVSAIESQGARNSPSIVEGMLLPGVHERCQHKKAKAATRKQSAKSRREFASIEEQLRRHGSCVPSIMSPSATVYDNNAQKVKVGSKRKTRPRSKKGELERVIDAVLADRQVEARGLDGQEPAPTKSSASAVGSGEAPLAAPRDLFAGKKRSLPRNPDSSGEESEEDSSWDDALPPKCAASTSSAAATRAVAPLTTASTAPPTTSIAASQPSLQMSTQPTLGDGMGRRGKPGLRPPVAAAKTAGDDEEEEQTLPLIPAGPPNQPGLLLGLDAPPLLEPVAAAVVPETRWQTTAPADMPVRAPAAGLTSNMLVPPPVVTRVPNEDALLPGIGLSTTPAPTVPGELPMTAQQLSIAVHQKALQEQYHADLAEMISHGVPPKGAMAALDTRFQLQLQYQLPEHRVYLTSAMYQARASAQDEIEAAHRQVLALQNQHPVAFGSSVPRLF